jgi:hypothetical protein
MFRPEVSPTAKPHNHSFLHYYLVEFGIIIGVALLVSLLIPFPISIPIIIVTLALVALHRRKRIMRRTGLLATNHDRHIVLNVIAHYSLLVLALTGITLLFPHGLDIPAHSLDIVIIALFVFRSERSSW